MPISPARLAAFNILLRVERESAYADELLHSPLLDDLSALDRNLTTEIVMGVLRWRSLLDETIARLSFTPFRKLDLEVLTALRMGIYQKQFLSKIPAHASVNETVELVKQAKKTSAAGLVNAVMRKVKSAPYDQQASKSLAHPQWLVDRWTKFFGPEKARLICEYDQRVPATALRLNSAEDEAVLKEQNIQLAPGALMKNARIVAGGDLTPELLQSHNIAIQDEGSQLIAALIANNATQGERILDCCAAPGSKTAAIATRQPKAEIIAAELHPHRAALLRKLVPQPNVQVITADATNLPYKSEFNHILADVPCSGTGTLARNPEIKWKLKPEDLADLQSRQIAILTAAIGYLRPGGKLVYSTCSLEPEENEQVIAACLKMAKDSQEIKIVPMKEELLRLQQSGELIFPDLDSLVAGYFLRTIPGVHPCDGFFAAVLKKD